MTELSKKVFRDKYTDNLTSPDQFDKYIKIMNPKIWVILVAMIIVLLNLMAWMYFQNKMVRIPTVGVAQDGEIVCRIKEDDKSSFDRLEGKGELYVYDADKAFDEFVSISDEPVEYSDSDNRYAAHLADIYVGEWVYEVRFKADLPDGVYKAIIRDGQAAAGNTRS